MLVLSRHRDETIIIGDDIELTVVDIRGDKVRIGIKAPSHIAVHRKEVYEAIKRENEKAAELSGSTFSHLPASGAGGAKKQDRSSAGRLVARTDPTNRRETA